MIKNKKTLSRRKNTSILKTGGLREGSRAKLQRHDVDGLDDLVQFEDSSRETRETGPVNYYKKTLFKNNYIVGLATGLLLAVLVLKLLPILSSKTGKLARAIPLFSKPTPTPTKSLAADPQALLKTILPEELDLGVSFNDTVVKMVQMGAIDRNKFLKLYEARGGLKPEESQLMDSPSSKNIVVNQQNSGLILNFLWPLGIANKTRVLSDGPMGTQYSKEVGNFASTGGWTVGKKDGGTLYNSLNVLSLTPDQEELVKELAQNIYRPCCGNSTYFPDCNHGAAMLGFLELAAASGQSREEIYKKALVLNSYWFPQTYAEMAIYFQSKRNTPWNRVDPKEALGQNFSSGQGYSAFSKELRSAGLLPEIKGGGGCGV